MFLFLLHAKKIIFALLVIPTPLKHSSIPTRHYARKAPKQRNEKVSCGTWNVGRRRERLKNRGSLRGFMQLSRWIGLSSKITLTRSAGGSKCILRYMYMQEGKTLNGD